MKGGEKIMANYEFSTLSVKDMANQFVREGMTPAEAIQKAQEEFPKRLSRLLDEGWKILIGDSDTVYLKRRETKVRRLGFSVEELRIIDDALRDWILNWKNYSGEYGGSEFKNEKIEKGEELRRRIQRITRISTS